MSFSELRHFIKRLTLPFHPEKLISDTVDKDTFSFHKKDKQAKIQRQFDKSVMIEVSCKHKRTEKKRSRDKKKRFLKKMQRKQKGEHLIKKKKKMILWL